MKDKIDNIQRYLVTATEAVSFSITALEPLSGGAIQENWRLEADVIGGPHAGRLVAVLRTDAPSVVAESRGRAEEFALLRAAFAAGVIVPEPLWLAADPAIAGKPFFVMRHLLGVADRFRIVKDMSLAPDRPALVRDLATQMARIHAIRPPISGLEFLPEPSPSPAIFWVARYRAFLDSLDWPFPGLEWALRWLELNAPAAPVSGVALCHNDFRTGNYLVDGSGLTAVLDWEFAGWGDPMADIGWFCARCWRAGKDEMEAGGIGIREDFYAAYEAASGCRIDGGAVVYWEVMAHLRWAVIAAQQAARHIDGGQVSLELALIGHVVPELELEILCMTEPD
ncbi:MAG: phosphotransferase family protein [Rhodospirillales bacterium]